MSDRYATLLGVSRLLVSLLRILNLVVGLLVIVMFVASFVFEPAFREFFSKRPPRIDPDLLIPTLRVWMLLAIPVIAAVHLLYTRLLAMIGTVRAGDPFVPENAVRLKTIAWCLLAVQIVRSHGRRDGGDHERGRLEHRLELLGDGLGRRRADVRARPGVRGGRADPRRPGSDDLTWPSP